MTAILNNLNDGEPESVAQWAAPRNGLKAIGVTDDNGGAPVLPRVLPYPFLIRASDPLFAPAQITGTVIVPAGRMLVITQYIRGNGIGGYPRITPAGMTYDLPSRGTLVIPTAGPNTRTPLAVNWPFGPGDTFAVGYGDQANGFWVSLDPTVTPICKGITQSPTTNPVYSITTLTVPTGKTLWVTSVLPTEDAQLAMLNLGGNPWLPTDMIGGGEVIVGTNATAAGLGSHYHGYLDSTYDPINNTNGGVTRNTNPVDVGGSHTHAWSTTQKSAPRITTHPTPATAGQTIGAFGGSYPVSPLIVLGYQF